MAKIIIKDRTTQFGISTSDNEVIVAKGVTVDSQTNGILEAADVSGNDYVIDGTLRSHGLGHAALNSNGADTTVTIGASGKLTSDYWAVSAFGDNTEIVNEGRIAGDSAGLGIAGDNSHLVNKGMIVSESGLAVSTDNLSSFRLDNSGTIEAERGMFLRIENLTLNFSKDSVVEIGKTGSIDLSLSHSGWTAKIRNSGEIDHAGKGQITAIEGGEGIEIIRNTGTITGSVFLGGGSDRYDGRGGRVIDGIIAGGDGDDRYFISNRKDDVFESAGDDYDRLTVSFSYTLDGNNEIEEIRLAGKGDFRLVGNDLQNYLEGNKGDNRLVGHGGADAFFGGAGDDVMTGGMGVDGFYFREDADREIVTDFKDGEDLLILFPGDEIESVEDLLANHLHQKGDDLFISGDGTTMILRDFDKADLTTADFTS